MRGLIAGTQNPEPRVTAVRLSSPRLPVPRGQEGPEQEGKGNGWTDRWREDGRKDGRRDGWREAVEAAKKGE